MTTDPPSETPDPGSSPTETVYLGPGPAPAAQAPAGLLPRGTPIGRYVILDRIGGGGMGVVYTGYDPELDRKVALKLLRPDRAAGEAARLRLLREAQAIARLSHPNVVAVHDAGTFGDQVFLAMEYVEGTTLRRWLDEERRPWGEVVDRFVLAGRGLAAAHAAGLVHRDFKPDNVLLGKDGRVRVADFGLARAAGETGAEEPASPESGGILESPITQLGTAVGTPAYMAPEQLRGERTDARSDQFSFCVALWEALYGERPFAGAAARGEVRQVPAGSRVPDRLRQALLRGLAADPAARYPALEELLDRLARNPEAARRRWLAAGVAVLAVGGVFAGLGYLQARRGQLCSGGEAKLAQVWNAGRKGEVRAAFLGTRTPFAEKAWTEVEGILDRYTRSWTQMHRGACEATRLRGEQSEDLLDRRMFCLDQRLREVDALTGVFARADREIVQRSVRAAAGLAPLADCADVRALTARVPPPADPAVRARVEALSREMARVRALRAAGRYPQGLALAREVSRKAEGAGYPPARAEALFLQGDLEERVGEHEPAERTLRQAVQRAEAAAADEVKAASAITLMFLIGEVQNRFEEAHGWGDLAAATLDRLGDQGSLRGQYLNDLGTLYEAEARYAEALKAHREAAAIRRRVEGERSPAAAAAVSNAGVDLFRLGRYPEAMASFEEALKIQEAALGPEHPEVGGSLNRIANVHYVQGRYEEAVRHHLRALKIREAAFGPRHRLVGDSLLNLGNSFDLMARYGEALEHYRRAAEVYRAALGPRSAERARALDGMGAAAMGLKDWDVANAYLRQALEVKIETLGRDHQSVAVTFYNLGLVAKDRGRPAEALPYFQQSLAIEEKVVGPDHPDVAAGLTSVAETELQLGRPEKALVLLDRALAALEKHDGEVDATVPAITRFALARTLWELGRDRDQALALAGKAKEGFLSVGGEGEIFAADVDRWLAGRAKEEKPLG
ncbi:MAG TPA: serine/threonine-protein kinase [Thermoanaerobaculia bacterium]|nr:serine/threonine-protein kinase [Thermoanaerobaculia bacterium]